jgi:hypothetical protein
MGVCDLCGVDILLVYLVEEEGSSSAMVKLKHFSMENIIIRREEKRKKLRLFYKSIIFSELIQYLKPKLQFFAHHNFVARWQDAMLKSCLQNCVDDRIVSIIDFAKNYSFEM